MEISREMETKNGIQAFYASTRSKWRKWLEENCRSENSIWLIIYKKKTKTPSVGFLESIEEAICFGWIDNKAVKRDNESFYLFFTQRNPKSTWSKANRERAEKMIKIGLMTQRGQELIDFAKKIGTWDALTDAQNSVIPDDLQKLFDKNETAFKNFEAFSPSSKRVILEWISKAKKPETRERRIVQTVELAANNIKAYHY
jgi:uncharacterized protein YdeI (YjbR/CyaY-like superfamily)